MLYIFTPVFCAGLCLGTVFSFLKFDNKVSANAATANAFTLNRSAQRFWYASKTSPASLSYSEMWGVKDAGNLSTDWDNATNTLSFGGASANANGEAIYAEVTASITVPAGQEYTVSYDLEYYSLRAAYVKSSIILEVFNFGYSNDTQTAPTGSSLGLVFGYNGSDSKYSIDFLADNTFSGGSGCSGSTNVTVTYRNKSYDNSQTFSQRFGVWTGLGYGGSTLYGACSISPSVTEVKDLTLELPSNISTDYTGTEYTDANLNAIDEIANASWYDPAKMTLSLREDTASNAGTYNIDVTLIDTDTTTGYPWKLADGTFSFDPQSITLTINKVTPSVTPTFPSGRPVVTNGFPQPTSYTATVNGKSITGTFDWINQAKLIEVDKPKEYEWTFKPDDSTNYISVKGKLTLNFQERKIQSKTYAWKSEYSEIYTLTSVDELMDMITLEVTYNDNPTTPVNETNFHIESANLVAGFGNSYVMVSFGSGAPEKYIIPSTVEVIEAAVESLTVMFNQNGKVITVETPLNDLKQNLTVWAKWNYNVDQIKIEDKSAYELSGTLEVNGSNVKVVYEGVEEPVTGITVSKATYNMNGVNLTGDLNPVYDGQPHALNLSGTLPNGVTAGDITYTKQGGTPSTTAPTDAGTYTVSVSFTGDSTNYNPINNKTATLQINKATVTGIVFEGDSKPEITGQTYTLEATGVPSWVTVSYSVEGQSGTSFSDAGTYKFTATFTHSDPNYEQLAPMTATLIISDKPPVEGAENIVVQPTIKVTYGSPVDYAAKNVPAGVGVSYVILKDGAPFSGTEIKDVGEYTITVSFTVDADKAPIADKTCVVTINKAEFDIEDYVTFSGKTVAYDGNEYTLAISGTLPEWIEVTYEVEGQDGTSFSAVGTYNFVAHFTHDSDNYEAIDDMPATLKITTAALTLDVTFEDNTVTYNGETHKLEITGELPVWVEKVTYYIGDEEFTGAVNAGTYTVTAKFTVDTALYEQPDELTATLTIKAAVYELTGVTFENGAFVYDGEAHSIFVGGAELPEWITVSYTGNEVTEIGTHTVTAKFEHADGNYLPIAEMTAQIVISKAKIALPVYKGTLSYTGDEIKPTAADFEGFDGAIMSLVADKTIAGLNAGTYKAVFALTDTDRYEWATATTLKKALFAVVYDEVVLEDNEAAVDWNIAKAKISATRANDKLPVFASESFTGSLADIVGLKYYSDETCTEEISADELAYSTKYYVKAELLNSENFELDETAMAFSKTAFEYTTPEKQLTVWEKIVKFVTVNWLWLVIAVVALILFIIIIACAARASRKRREREERRLAEERAERERKEEREEQRRREDREERMARLSQQQMMMPQMMPQMPQQMPMPQSVPAAQPMAAGGASSNEIAELRAEMAAMKASQDMAKELAIRAEMAAREMALRAEQNAVMRSDINAMRGGEQTSGIIGISMDKLTELVEKTVEKVLGKEKPAAEKANDGAATVPECPPDAVMTTVTTTKIDTTKKPAQPVDRATAQAAAPVRTVVRNVVAPMPVDDGRVFDVGGFYTPADPMTDMVNMLGDDEDKD